MSTGSPCSRERAPAFVVAEPASASCVEMLTASSLPCVARCAGTRSSSWNHVLGQVAQHTFAEELRRLRRIVPGRGERGRELGFR